MNAEVMPITNSLELRRSILQDLAQLRAGAMTAAQARVRASMAKQALDLLKMEFLATDHGAETVEPLSLVDRIKLAPATEAPPINLRVIRGM